MRRREFIKFILKINALLIYMSYTDLVNIDDFAKRDIFVESRGDITFYCKDCQKIVETNRPNNKGYTFVCEECK